MHPKIVSSVFIYLFACAFLPQTATPASANTATIGSAGKDAPVFGERTPAEVVPPEAALPFDADVPFTELRPSLYPSL